MKLSTSLLFISWVPLLQLYLIHSEEKSIWVFLVSIVLAIIGVWCVTKSLPAKPGIPVSMPSVVSIIVILVLSAGTTIIFLGIFHTAGSIGDGLTFPLLLFLLFISMSLGIWFLEKFTKWKPIHRVLISIIVIALSLFIAYAIENRFISFLIFFFFSIGVISILLWRYFRFFRKMKSIDSLINYILINFFSIMLSAIPIFSGIQELFDIDLNVFTYEAWTFSLIFSIISVGISSTALFLSWREIQEGEKSYIPVLKTILASIFFLWQMNLGLHFYFHLPIDLFYGGGVSLPEILTYMEPGFSSYFSLKGLAVFVYIILNLVFFGWIFFKGKFKERQPLFFSASVLLMVMGLYVLLFILVNSTHLIPHSLKQLRHLTVIPISFITIIGPVLLMALVLVVLGGLLSLFKKRSRHSSFQGVVPKKTVVISLVTVLLYVLLFKSLWPIKDPAPDILFAVVKNRMDKLSGGKLYMAMASWCEFLSYGKREVMPLVKKLEDNDASVRYLSAEFLVFLGDERAVEPLINALTDGDRKVQSQAATALTRIKDPRAIKPLIQALEKNKLDDYAIKHFGDWKDYRFIDPLLEKLDVEDEKIRESIINALGNFKDARVVDMLIEYLKKEKASNLIYDYNWSLQKITGYDYPRDKYKKDAHWWQQWWDQNREYLIKKWEKMNSTQPQTRNREGEYP